MPQDNSNNGSGSISGALNNSSNLVNAVITFLMAVMLLGVFLAGFFAMGGGKIAGSIPKNIALIGADAWREAKGMKPDEPIELGKLIPFEIVGKDQQPSGSQTQGQSTQQAQPVQPTSAPKVNAEDEKRLQQMNQQLLETAKYWQTTGKWDETTAKLDAVAGMLKPGEDTPMLYDRLSAEVQKVKTAAVRILPDYEAYKKSGSELSARYGAAMILKNDAATVFEFLSSNGLTTHQSYKAAKTALELTDKALRIMDAYRSALKADTALFGATVGEAWSGTKWKVTEYTDAIGSCRCATIEALDESVKGLRVTIPAAEVKKFSKGLLESYVGKTLTFK